MELLSFLSFLSFLLFLKDRDGIQHLAAGPAEVAAGRPAQGEGQVALPAARGGGGLGEVQLGHRGPAHRRQPPRQGPAGRAFGLCWFVLILFVFVYISLY